MENQPINSQDIISASKKRFESKTECPICHDIRPCFARKWSDLKRTEVCSILNDTYKGETECPFCKEVNPWAKDLKEGKSDLEDIEF